MKGSPPKHGSGRSRRGKALVAALSSSSDGFRYQRPRRGLLGPPQRKRVAMRRTLASGTPVLPTAGKEGLSGHRRITVGDARGIATG
jgi:hypothetical protein